MEGAATRLVRPRIDYLPRNVIDDILELEEKFTLLQQQMIKYVDEDCELPQLVIPEITQAAIEFNDEKLTPANRSLQMLVAAKGLLLDE